MTANTARLIPTRAVVTGGLPRAATARAEGEAVGEEKAGLFAAAVRQSAQRSLAVPMENAGNSRPHFTQFAIRNPRTACASVMHCALGRFQCCGAAPNCAKVMMCPPGSFTPISFAP